MTWNVWVKVQAPEPAPVSLVGELEDNLDLSQEQVELLLGAVSDAEDSSEESVQPRELPPYRDGPWNDDAAGPRDRRSRAAGSQDAGAADHDDSESETEIMAFSLFTSWKDKRENQHQKMNMIQGSEGVSGRWSKDFRIVRRAMTQMPGRMPRWHAVEQLVTAIWC